MTCFMCPWCCEWSALRVCRECAISFGDDVNSESAQADSVESAEGIVGNAGDSLSEPVSGPVCSPVCGPVCRPDCGPVCEPVASVCRQCNRFTSSCERRLYVHCEFRCYRRVPFGHAAGYSLKLNGLFDQLRWRARETVQRAFAEKERRRRRRKKERFVSCGAACSRFSVQDRVAAPKLICATTSPGTYEI